MSGRGPGRGENDRDMTDRFDDDGALVAALRARDDSAFAWLVDRYHAPLARLARRYVPSEAVAEEVVQDTFLAVFEGLDRFEGRSTLKTWMYRILLNIARTRGVREHRSVPFASLASAEIESDTGIDRDRFLGSDVDPRRHWTTSPQRWDGAPEERVLAGEVRSVLEAALAAMPPAQREVVVMRDVLGLGSEEVRNALEISETNQRVLLHRARTRLRWALDAYFLQSEAGGSEQP